MRRAVVLAGLLALLVVLACGERATTSPSCLDAPAPLPEFTWVDEMRRSEDGSGVEIVFGTGRVLRLPSGPRAIVSTLPGITETLLFLGAGDRLVAATPHCRLPPELADLPRISVMPLSRERLAALAPDLVVVDGVLLPQAEEELERLGFRVLPVETRSLAHWRMSVDLLAWVLDTEEARGQAMLFQADLTTAAAFAARGEAHPRVLLLADVDPLHVLGPGSLLDDMVRQCGGVNVACDLGRASGPFSEELVLARRPDVVLLLGGELPESLQRRWARVPAVTNDRCVPFSDDPYLQAGPHVSEALRALSAALHGAKR